MAYQQLNVDQVTVAAIGFKGPEGVVVDRDGNVYGGGTDGVIRKLSPEGRVTEFARTGGRPAGMALGSPRQSLRLRRRQKCRTQNHPGWRSQLVR